MKAASNKNAGNLRPPVNDARRQEQRLCAQVRRERDRLLRERNRLMEECVELEGNRARILADYERQRNSSQLQFEKLRQSFRELEKKYHYYSNLYDFAPVGYLLLDARGRVQDLNKAAALLLGGEYSRLVNRRFHAHIAKADLPLFRDHLRRCQKSNGAVISEIKVQPKEGGPIVVQFITTPYRCPGDGPAQYRTALVDITPHQAAQEQLASLRLNHQSLIDAIEGIVWEATLIKGRLQCTFVSRQAERLLGYSARCWTERAGFWRSRLHPEDRTRATAERSLALEARRNYKLEYRLIARDGRVVWVRDTVTISGTREKGFVLRGLMLNITEQQEILQMLRKTYDQLEARVRERTMELTQTCDQLRDSIARRQELENELLDITERERRRIGVDLHDDLGQRLTGLSLMLKSLEVNLEKKKIAEASQAASLRRVVDQTMAHTQDLAHNLAAVNAGQEDLVRGLRTLAARVRNLFPVRCRLALKGSSQDLDPQAVMHLCRIAQEAITNAIRHAKARRIDLDLEVSPERLRLSIRNDGLPFPKTAVKNKGMGLGIMQYRARLIGATFQIGPNGDSGAIVNCELPLAASPRKARRGA